MKLTYKSPSWILIICVALETITSTYFTRNNLSLIYFSSVLYFLCGVAISLIPMIQYKQMQSQLSISISTIQKYFAFGFFVLISAYTFYRLVSIYQLFPVDYHRADMIPQIIVECNRWLAGEWVYQPTPIVSDLGIPTYLPMMWLPYVPSVILGIDVRWTTPVFFLAAFGIIFWNILKTSRLSWPQFTLIISLLIYVIFIQTSYNDIFFAWTEEGIVVFYFVLLGVGLISRKSLLIVIGITCCLLSRYTLFFWIPAYFLFYFLMNEKKKAITEAAGVTILTLIIFVIPFFIHDPMYFLSLPQKYHLVTPIAWTAYPQIVYESMGLAKFFSFEQIDLLHSLSLAFSILIPFLFYAIIFLNRKKTNLNLQLAGICGLKLTLAFFYAFVEIPYYYLFFVNTIFSYVVIIGFLAIKNQHSNKSFKNAY